jgi:hypothetical protein
MIARQGRADRPRPRIVRAQTVSTPHTLTITWAGAPGATQAEVDDASLDIDAASAAQLPTEPFDPAFAQVGGLSMWDVTVPPGLRVRSLALVSLADVNGNPITEAAFPDGGRLTLSLPDPRGGFGAPLFAVPPVAGHGVYPRSLGGAGFASGVLSLPDVQATTLRLAVVSSDPAELDPRGDVALGRITGVGVRYPSGLQLTDESGAVMWANPRELPPGLPSVHVDLKATLKKALNDKAKTAAGGPVSVALTLTAAAPTKLAVSGPAVSGALVRRFPGVTRTTVTGETTPVALALGPGEPPLALDATARVTADVTLRYDGQRVLPFSDPIPAADDVRGRIVGADPVLRVLPPQSLTGLTVTRIGLVGFAPEPCELSVRLVRPLSGDPLPGDPAVVRIDPAAAVRTVWAELPQPASPREAAAVAVRTTRGRFFWTTRQDDAPRVRIAVLDAQPAARRITLDGVVLPDDPSVPHRAGVDLTAYFTSPAPVFDSLLFYTVDLSDLTVRYRR